MVRDAVISSTSSSPPTGGAGGDSPGKLRNQVATLIVAGHETTAIALFWAFNLLAREPDWQERIAAEAMAQDLTPAGVGERYRR
jgi:cytochrome P450